VSEWVLSLYPCTGSQPAGDLKPSTRQQAAITFRQACGYLPSRRASPPIGRYQIILLGDRGTCVSSLPKAVTWKRTGQDSNPRPFGSRANALPLSHTGHRRQSGGCTNIVQPTPSLNSGGSKKAMSSASFSQLDVSAGWMIERVYITYVATTYVIHSFQ